MSQDTITYVGLDVHKRNITVAVQLPDGGKPVVWDMGNTPRCVRKMVEDVREMAIGSEVLACYEAGPCGYVLQRQLLEMGWGCQVIAPAQIPQKPGDRIKTDRRDACKLVALLPWGLLTEVHPPTPEQEAVRNLCRCREDIRQDLTRSRNRMGKFLLRQGVTFTDGKRAWTQKHMAWLRKLRFEQSADQQTLDNYLLVIDRMDDHLKAVEAQIQTISETEPYKDVVAALKCFHGIATITAMTIVSEVLDIGRFDTPRQLMCYLGLVPSEYTSSDRRRLGSITKTGNSHVRRVLIEAAWQQRQRPIPGPAVKKRRKDQLAWVVLIAEKAHQRLHRKFYHLVNAAKAPQVAATAVARELVGFIWAVLYPDQGRQLLKGSK